MKKYITAGLIGLAFLTGCQKTALVENPRIIQQKENKISYRLEDLCDTEIYEKDKNKGNSTEIVFS